MNKVMQLTLTNITVSAALSFGAAAQSVNLEVEATPSIFKPMFEKLVAEFEEKNPDVAINLNASERDQNNMIQKLLRLSITDNLPDVSFQGYNYLRILADRELAVPLEPFMTDDDGWTDDAYSASVTSSATVNGSILGLGVGMSFPIMYYNSELVERALGPDAPMPDTWSKIIDLGEAIGEFDPSVTGLLIRTHPWVFQAMVESQGGQMMDADERSISFSGPEGTRVFEILKQIGEAGQADGNLTREQGRQAFAAGKVGILIDSSSSLNSLQEQAAKSFEIRTAPLPTPSEDARIPAAGIASVMITRDSERQAAAWRFMSFVSSVEGQTIVGTETGYVPANSISTQYDNALGDYYAAKPAMKAAIDTLPYASTWYTFPGENAIEINKKIGDAMERLVTLRSEPDSEMSALKNDVQALIID